MRKLKLILNPTAGKGLALKYKEMVTTVLNDEALEFQLVESQYEGEIEKLASEVEVSQFTDLIIIGGDGSLVEAVNGIGKKDIRMGIVPVGTGNDFARTLLGSSDPSNALQKIIAGGEKLVDVGWVNGRRFINVTGFGIDSYILQNMDKIKKVFKGSTAYLVSTLYTLMQYKSKKVWIKIGDQTYEREIMLAAISNAKYFGGGMMISPESEIDDGLFELVIVNKLSIPRFLRLFKRVYNGTHLGVEEVEVFKADTFFIDAIEDIPINVDGNLYGLTPIEVKAGEEKIRFLC